MITGCSFVEDRSTETVAIVEAGSTPTQTLPAVEEITDNSVKATQTYIVQSGDTLGSIARKVLGNSKRYIEIAQLNNLSSYDAIYEGQRLALPSSSVSPRPVVTTSHTQATQENNTPSSYPELEQLMDKEHYNQAIQWIMLRQELAKDPVLQSTLIKATDHQVNIYLQQNQKSDAQTLLRGLIQEAPLTVANKQSLMNSLSSLTAQQDLEVARQLANQSHYDKAYDILLKAYKLDAANLEKNVLFTGTRNQVNEHYHQQALKLYRNQQLDEALIYWNKILQINPNDDLALVYKDRVKALQEKLKAL